MTYEPKEREILDQVVAALHGHYGERLSRGAALVGGVSRSVRKTSALVGGTSRSVRRTSTLVGGASRSVRKTSTLVGGASRSARKTSTLVGGTSRSVRTTSALVGGAVLGIFIHPAHGGVDKNSHISPTAYCDCAILNTFITAGLTPRSASTALFSTN